MKELKSKIKIRKMNQKINTDCEICGMNQADEEDFFNVGYTLYYGPICHKCSGEELNNKPSMIQLLSWTRNHSKKAKIELNKLQKKN